MAEWRVFYGDGSSVRGTTTALGEWAVAPVDGVQAVVVMEPYPDGRRPWKGVDDRQIWTGDDPYDPASPSARREVPSLPSDWPPKRGTLIDDETYQAIWREAAYGPS